MEEFVKQTEALKAAGEEVEKIQAATTEEEVVLLNQIVEAIKPVMRYIDYKIKIHGHRPGHQFGKWEYEHYQEKGLILVDCAEQHATDGDLRGIYRGHFLVLTRSGKFLKFDQSGEWSRWQNESSYFQNEPSEITTEQAVKIYEFEDIINGISVDFKEAVEKAEGKRQALKSRQEQLDKIRELLKA